MQIQYQWVCNDGVILATETVTNGVRTDYAQVSPPPVLTDPQVELQYRYLPDLNWVAAPQAQPTHTFTARYKVIGRSLNEQLIDLANSRTGECDCGCEDETQH